MSSPRQLSVRSILGCPAGPVWAKLQTPELLQTVIRPLLQFVPPADAPFPPRWEQGAVVRGRLYVYGVLPLGPHAIRFERVDQERMEIQTRETGRLIRSWNHKMSIRPDGEDRTLYTDEVEIECGLLTPPVWLLARWLYRHRHRRWQVIARRLAAG